MLQRTIEIGAFLSSDAVARAPIGGSPHAVIHRQHETALRFFAPVGHATARPLFISMPLINTWSIFDLLPERSVVAALTQAGVPVYLLDWGRAGPQARDRPLHVVIDDILPRALRRATRHARQQGTLAADALPDALGYCVGGTFLAICLSRHPLARRVALLAAPIDFHASGRLSRWADPGTFPLDDIVDGLGNFPPALMRTSFSWLRPMGQVGKWKTLWDRWESDFPKLWAALERWSGDAVPFPGECYREYVRRCYFDNALMTGGWVLDGAPVRLDRGTIPATVIAASTDHICPEAAAFGLARVWGGAVQTATVRGGHVGVCIGEELPAMLRAWVAP